MWFIGVEVEQGTSAPPPTKNPGSAPVSNTIAVAIFPNLCLWRRNLFSNLGGIDPDKTVSSHHKGLFSALLIQEYG